MCVCHSLIAPPALRRACVPCRLTYLNSVADHQQAVEAAADDLPGVLGVMKQHLEAQNSGA